MPKCVLTLLLAYLALGASHIAQAQELQPSETGTIRGSVLDPNGAVVVGAEIRAIGIKTSQVFITKSNDTVHL